MSLNTCSLKKCILFAILSLWFVQAKGSGHLPVSVPKPRITIIATGGTIAGMASSATGTSYDPAQLTVDALMAQAPGISETATITGMQLCNIASQHMTTEIWIRLASMIDSLFKNSICDGVVVTHGTDTMEETAFFLDLVLGYDNPVVLTGAMRPANALGADGPANLFNAVCLAGVIKRVCILNIIIAFRFFKRPYNRRYIVRKLCAVIFIGRHFFNKRLNLFLSLLFRYRSGIFKIAV